MAPVAKSAGGAGRPLHLAAFFLGVALLCLAVGPPANADGAGSASIPAPAASVVEWGGLKIRAELGFGGQFRPGSFTPLRLIVENTGRTLFHGFVGITVVRPAGISGESRESYRAEVLAGSPARLELPFIIPLRSSFDQLILQLWDPAGQVVTEKQLILPPLPQKQSLWLILRYQPSTSPWLALLVAAAHRLAPEFPIFTAYITEVSRFFTDPVALTGVELMIVDDISLRQLSRAAATAIQAWVDRGGLLLITGAAAQRNAATWPWPQDFLPMGVNSPDAGRGTPTLTWVRHGRGSVVFWPGSLEAQAGGLQQQEGVAEAQSAVAEILRLRQATRTRPLLSSAASPGTDLDGAIATVLRETPLTGTRRGLLASASFFYTLLLAIAGKRTSRPRNSRRWLVTVILLWIVAVAGAAAFARRENARLIRAAAPVVEVATGSTARLWQDTRIYRAVPHPGHSVPIAVPSPSSSSSSSPAASPAALPAGVAGNWQFTWTLARQALLSGDERILGLSWVQLAPASLRWEWFWPDTGAGADSSAAAGRGRPYLRIVNPLADTTWILGLAAWPEGVLTATLAPGARVALPLPPVEPGDPAGTAGPAVDEVAGELAGRLLPALLPDELPLPASQPRPGAETLALARTLWQQTHAELVGLALEEGTGGSATRWRHDPVLLLALGLPLPTNRKTSAGAERGATTLRLLALWVEPPAPAETGGPGR